MPKMNIKRSVTIDAPAAKIYPILNDFNQWTAWSPWLIMDPNATVNVASDNKSYTWEGKRVGSGNMKVLDEKENASITYDLNFLKPWKSHADVKFELEEEGDVTKVSWYMDSSLPFFMFFMKKMMEAYVGADYDRGLHMLKALVEQGKVPSELDFLGESTFNGCKYIGIKTDTQVESVGQQMESDFEKIWEYARKDLAVVGDAFTIYHKWDMVNDKISYTSGVPVTEIPDDLPEGFVSGAIPKTKIYSLQHTGAYLHLGNAWTTLYNMQRSKEFKSKRGIDPFETYLNTPEKTPQNELVTQIHFAVK